MASYSIITKLFFMQHLSLKIRLCTSIHSLNTFLNQNIAFSIYLNKYIIKETIHFMYLRYYSFNNTECITFG